jgi:hypothetical protein
MSGGSVFNENGEVVGIVSRGVSSGDESRPWSSALWLEALSFSEDSRQAIFQFDGLAIGPKRAKARNRHRFDVRHPHSLQNAKLARSNTP